MSKEALLVIDVQVGMLEGEGAVYQADTILARVQTLIQSARSADVPVIFVQHDEALEYDGPLHPSLAIQANEPVIHKLELNAFRETNLQATLDKLGIKKLVIAGLSTNYCINANVRQAHELGYEVQLVADAHSTMDSKEEDAASIISRYNEDLSKIAKLVPTEAIKFGA